jgi:cyclin B
MPITKYFLKTENNQKNSEVNKCEVSFNKGINEEKNDLKQYEINQVIKNKNNPQYLTEYIYDILENLLLDESSYISNNYIDSNYLLSSNNTELSEEIREVSINWLIMIIYKIFKFKENTLFLTVQIIDRFLSKKILSVERTELLILCSLILSSKHEEIDYVNMVESLQLSSNKFSKEDIINMQYEILNELNFELIIPTMNDYYNIYCTILNFDEINTNKGLFLLNIVLVDYHIIKYPNFLVSLGVVKLIYKKNFVWLIKRIRFFFIKNKQDKFLAIISDEKNLDNVCDEIKKIYKKYLDNKYKNIEEKFSDEKYNSVANISEDLIDVSDI